MFSSCCCELPYHVAFVITFAYSCWHKAALPRIYQSHTKIQSVSMYVCGTFIKQSHTKVFFLKLVSHSQHSPGISVWPWCLEQFCFWGDGCVGFSGDPICYGCASKSTKKRLCLPRLCASKPASRQVLPSALQPLCCAWPHTAVGRCQAHSWRQQWGSSNQRDSTEAWGGLDVGGFLRRSKAEVEKEGKRSEKEEQGKMKTQQNTVQEPEGWSPPAQLDNSVKLERSSRNSSWCWWFCSFPSSMGSRSCCNLPPKAIWQEKNKGWITEKGF